MIRYLATERGLSEAYQLSVRETLDALAGWLKRRGGSLRDLGTEDPAEPLLAPRPEKDLPETLHAAEIDRLLESIDPTKPLGRRDLAILELFYGSGLRLSELCQARLEMMDFTGGFLRVTGKGGKTRIVRVSGKALAFRLASENLSDAREWMSRLPGEEQPHAMTGIATQMAQRDALELGEYLNSIQRDEVWAAGVRVLISTIERGDADRANTWKQTLKESTLGAP
ncbi:MAG: tyrosine-type recombinase/integrase [Verrucomicrobia bacterium]|nr:tyrosine-type recombinase/integrase [Verrucomicrobiota bacterium]